MPSSRDAHLEILRVLREEPDDTVTIVAVGPLTNVAMAAIEDAETFSRGSALSLYLLTIVHEVIVMGGTLILPGNITPFGGNHPRPCMQLI